MESELFQWGILFFFALVGGVIAYKTKLPPVLGLLIVGTLIGPSVLNLVKAENLDLMIELGALLLLFVTGLEFDVHKLKKLTSKAFVAAVLKVGIVFFTAYYATLVLGYSMQIAAMLGVILSLSSTIVIVKILQQNQLYTRTETPFLIGILVAEDIVAIIFLAIFDAASSMVTLGAAFSTFSTIIFSLIVMVILYLLSIKFLQKPIKYILANSAEEAVLFLDFFILVLFSSLAYFLNLSPSIGAFLGGSLIASLPNPQSFEKSIQPFSMFFSSFFFIAMGSLVNLQSIQDNMVLIAVLIVVIFVSRLIGIGIVTNILANFKQEQAMFSSLAMFSVGEFSLLIARHAPNLSHEVDLISIAAAIIFISAIMMAFSVKKSHSGVAVLQSFRPPGIAFLQSRLRLLADYLHHGFEKLDLETTYTRSLKADLAQGSSYLLTAFLLLYFWLPAIKFFNNVWGISIIFGGLLIILLNMIYKTYRSAFHYATFVFANGYSERRRSAEIIITMFLFFLVFLSALYLPLISSILQFTQGSLIAIILLIIAMGILHRLIELIDGSSQYKEMIVKFGK